MATEWCVIHLCETNMNNRIKVGDVYLELSAGSAKRPIPVAAEKPEMPEMLDPVAFTAAEPDSVDQYIARAPAGVTPSGAADSAGTELDRLSAWRAFTGARSTQPQQWLDYADGRAKHCGFNMTAWLFGFQWFIFHKMYVSALIAAVAEVSITFMTIASVLDLQGHGRAFKVPTLMAWTILLVGLSIPRLAMGYWANIALYKKASKQIETIQRFKIDRDRKLAMMAAAGSGNVVGLIVLYVAFVVIKIVVVNGH